jgi:hypothetical protein
MVDEWFKMDYKYLRMRAQWWELEQVPKYGGFERARGKAPIQPMFPLIQECNSN